MSKMTTDRKIMRQALDVLDPTDPGHDVEVLREHVRHLERRVRELSTPQPAPTKIEKGFRWDGEAQQHIPNLLIEFEPVPVDSPITAKGWEDRDSLARTLAAAPQPAVLRPLLTDEEIEQAYREIWRSLRDDFGHTSSDWIEAGIRYAERFHGITGDKP